MKPESYREQPACVNCCLVFTREEFGSEDCLFCHCDGSDRPPCGSVLMDEDFTRDKKDYRIGSERWRAWSRGREVAANGICDWYKEANDAQT